MATEIKRSFAGGEAAPAFYARVDVGRYASSLRTCRNFEVMRHGGAQNRPGSKFVAEAKDSSKALRLIPFVFNNDQTYVLVFGDFTMRVIKNGGQGLEASKNISSINQANPGVLTVTSHGYSNGQELALSNIEGMTALNGRNLKVANVTTNTFTLKYPDGTDVDTSAMGPYTTVLRTGKVARVYEIATPYAVADLPEIRYAQSADIVNLVHKLYPPYELARTGDLTWTLTPTTFIPTIARPAGLSGSVGGSGSNTYRYKVTAIAKADGAESLPAVQAPKTISAATAANPVVITANSHGYNDGEEVLITGVVGMTQLNGKVFVVAGSTTNTFQLQGIDGSAYTAYTSGGQAFRTSVTLPSATAPTLLAPNVITWTTSFLAQEYDVYREENGQFGFLGVAVGGTFNDIGAPINATKTPPIFRNPFDAPGNYPGAVSYHQQRLAFANSTNNPQTIWESRTGFLHDFSISSPIQDDDALTYRLNGTRVQEIRNLMETGKLLAFTSGSEFSIEGDASGVVTPFAINSKQNSGHGSSSLQPINVDGLALFVQARGSKVRDFSFDLYTDGYHGNDVSIFATHLFDGYTLVDWAFQQEPNSIVWAVRSDGTLLGLTYIREQQITGWHRHDTDGAYENVCTVPEGQEDAVYVVVRRTVMMNGVAYTGRYVERFAQRRIDEVQDCIFMDAALSFDGTNVDPAWTMTLTSAGGWSSTDEVTITASLPSAADSFTVNDIGKAVRFTSADGKRIDIKITTYVSTTQVKGIPTVTVPADLQGVAISAWAFAVREFGGLWHIEGRLVSVLGDGFVVGSPANPKYTRYRVTGGKITLGAGDLSVVCHIGLFYPSDIETLDLDTMNGETMVDKAKLISKVSLFLQESRGLFVGDRPPAPAYDYADLDAQTSFVTDLDELPARDDEDQNDPVNLLTDTADVIISPRFNKNGRVFIRQVDPLPTSVLAIAATGLIPR